MTPHILTEFNFKPVSSYTSLLTEGTILSPSSIFPPGKATPFQLFILSCTNTFFVVGSIILQAETICRGYAGQFDAIDSLILGCTHYPLVKEYFRTLLPEVKIISQDELMGAKLQNYLQRHPEISACLSRNHADRFEVSRLNTQALNVSGRLFP